MQGTCVILVDALQLFRRLQRQLERAHRRFCMTLGMLAILGLFVRSAPAQGYLTSTGMPSFAAPEPVELGFVDASNGNLHLSIPLGSYPQRGSSQPEPITLEYDSDIWAPVDEGISTNWEPQNAPGGNGAGWYLSYESGPGVPNPLATQNCSGDYYWNDQNGTTHVFHMSSLPQSGCPSSADAFATDSSGYHMFGTFTSDSDNINIYAPDGTLVSATQLDPKGLDFQSEDSNGNYMSHYYYGPIDTLGRQISNGATFTSTPTVTVMTSQGTAQYSVTYATINVKSNFQWAGIQDTSTQITVIRSLTLPDAAQSTYYFTYDCDESSNSACGSPSGQSAYYGVLTGITLPTGGTVSYGYSSFVDAYGNDSLWVHTRSTATGRWVYAPTAMESQFCSPDQYGASCQQQTTVISPTGVTTYTFDLDNGAWPVTIEKQDLDSNVLSTVTNTWDFSQPCVTIGCHGNSFIRLLSQKTTIPSSSGSLTKQTSYSYDSPQYGNITAIKEWGYIPSGNSFGSVPDRATYTSYLYYTGTNLNNINRPESITMCNNSGSDSACPGGGSRVSQTLYTYDASAPSTVNGVAQHDDQNFGSGYTTRGNATSISRWVSGSTYLTTSYTYDTTGQILTEKDPAGNITTFGYADKFYTDNGNDPPAAYTPSPATNAFVTSETDAVGTQTFGYYWGSGKTAISTDYNSQSTYSHYQEGLDRQTEEIDPIGWSLATYSSATQSDMYTAVADTSPSAGCASCQHTRTVSDSYGRTASQILVNDPIGPVEVDSTYDSSDRLFSHSHPYSGSGDPNHVSETFGYDASDRQISTTHPDGESQQVAFGQNVGNLQGATSQQGSTGAYGYGYPQVSQDESGNRQEQWLNAFGQIIEVDEPGASGSLTSSPLVTNYLYDAGGHLTEVVQGSETRTFQYDGLGRKIYENTPEGGTVTYSYVNSSGGLCSGDSSNVCYRTDARGVVSTYTYNSANQLTGVAYTVPSGENISSMPNVCTTTNGSSANVCYFYGQGANAVGRLTEMVDPTGSESYSYDPDGRVTQLSKVVSGQTYNIGYQFEAGGDVTQMTYPSGRVVQQAYNAVGQLCEIAPTATGCSDNTYYAGSFSYNAPGKLTGFTYGNGVTGTFAYSPDRTQLVYLAYTKANSTYFSLQYSYCQNSQYSPQCPNGTSGNNGSVQCITDNVDKGRSTNFSYDPLERLASAKTCGSSAYPQWGLAESYDRFGNRLSQSLTAGSGPSTSMSFNGNNQPVGYTYDPSGNMTVEPLDPPNDLTYDGENRMTAFQGGGGAASYSYDGNGMRVIKSVQGGTTTVNIFSGSSVIAEYDNGAAPGSPSREYIYNPAGGSTTGLLAMISSGTTTYFHQDDQSVRLTTDANGNVLAQQGTYPFGESWYTNLGPEDNWVFTSYDRDSESGLDYALARYYDSRTGTFCSADPLAGDPSDPQSWNRYPYGRNDPIDMTDPSGKGWLSILLDIGIGIGAALLPEADPALFAWGGTTSTVFYAGAQIAQSSTDFYALSEGIGFGTAAAGAAAAAQNAPDPNLANARSALKQVQKNKFNKKPCRKDLKALGTTPQAMQAGAQNAQLFNGTTSNALRSSLFNGNPPSPALHAAQAQFRNQTISQTMAANPGIEALSVLNGNSIYINPGLTALSATNTFWDNAAMIAHEVVHNVTGFTDNEIQSRLGLKVSDTTKNISDKLKSDCF